MAYYNLGDTFRWFMGRVVELDPTEDPKDKRYLGRVKVRTLHEQTGELGKKKKTFGIIDDDLLWAWPLSSIQSASLSYRKIVELEEFQTPFWIDAVGTSPTGIAVGTYVFGFYLDGHEKNIPVIFGTYHKSSIYPEPPTDEPTGKFLQIKPPEEDYPYMDVSALAKGWHEDTQREANHPLGQDYPLATDPGKGGQMLPKHPYHKGQMNIVWQPASDYDTEYPYNFVHTTKSGHAIELDDTPGHERMQWWHRSGSYEEVSNNKQGLPNWRDALPGAYPDTMRGWLEPNKNHEPGLHPPWEGRRVKKTVGNDYTISLENKETYVGASVKLEVVNSTTSGIGNNHVETIANNMFIAVGYYPRTANNQLAGESARYQLNDSWINETTYRENADKKTQILPNTHKYDFITDVANNVQLSVGWSWKKSRELDTHSEKNNYVEIANNQYTSLGWIPRNNYDKDGESRQLSDFEKTNQYFDIKGNSVSNIGWKPKDEARLLTDKDINNNVVDIKNNSLTNIGWHPINEARQVLYDSTTNFTIDVKNNGLLNIGWNPQTEGRALTTDDTNNLYIDVKNNYTTVANNNYYLSVGVDLENQHNAVEGLDSRSLFIDVANNRADFVGAEYAQKIGGNKMTHTHGNRYDTTEYAHYVRAMSFLFVTGKGKSGATTFISDVTVGDAKNKRSFYVNGPMGSSMGASDSFTTPTGRTVTVVNGIITSIA